MVPKLEGAKSISEADIAACLNKTRVHMVPKFHVAAHVRECRYRYSPDYTPGAARTDGESNERVWSDQNGIAARTKEMSEGHRHDAINWHQDDKNGEKTSSLCECTSRHLVACVLTFEHRQRAYSDDGS